MMCLRSRGLQLCVVITLLTGVLVAPVRLAGPAAAASPTPQPMQLGTNTISSAAASSGVWCMAVANASDAEIAGNHAQITTCDNTWNAQLWTTELDGTVRIRNRCLDAPATGQGTQVLVDMCQGTSTPGEQWVPYSDGTLRNTASGGLCLGITGGTLVGGANLIIWPCNGAATQNWYLPATTTKAASVAARLQLLYNDTSNLFEGTCSSQGGNCWWWSANDLNALVDYLWEATATAGSSSFPGSARYEEDLTDTRNHYYVCDSGGACQDGFTQDGYFDDAGWWGLMWLNAYNLSGKTDTADLTVAEDIFTFIQSNGWDPTTTGACPGGVWQFDAGIVGKTPTKDAIANELFMQLGARLARTTGDSSYSTGFTDSQGRHRPGAQDVWAWISTHLLVEASVAGDPVAPLSYSTKPGNQVLVADHVDANCNPAGLSQMWTYNQGVILGGLHTLYQLNAATPPGYDDPTYYLQPAVNIADTALNDGPNSGISNPPLVDSGGTLSEPCESFASDWPAGCAVTGKDPNNKPVNNSWLMYKGIFMQNLYCLSRDATGSPGYVTFMADNADTAWNMAQDRTTSFSDAADLNLFGFLWDNDGSTTWKGSEDVKQLNEATQGSVLELLDVNMGQTASMC